MTNGGSSGYDTSSRDWDQLTFVDGLDRDTKEKEVTVINAEHNQGIILAVRWITEWHYCSELGKKVYC